MTDECDCRACVEAAAPKPEGFVMVDTNLQLPAFIFNIVDEAAEQCGASATEWMELVINRQVAKTICGDTSMEEAFALQREMEIQYG